MVEADIVRIVRQVQRGSRGERGVFPRMVQPRLDYYRAEQTLRRDMMRLVDQGVLIRVGGRNARRGYKVPSSYPARRLLHHAGNSRVVEVV